MAQTLYVDAVTHYIDKAKELLADEGDKEYFASALDSVKAAKEIVADNKEKLAYLEDAVTRWANQMTFTLFREGTLTEELEKEYRGFKPVKETTAKCDEFKAARQAEIDKINAEHEVILRAQNGFDIFRAVVGGMTKDEAKAKLEEYEAKLAQAQNQIQR